MDGNENPGAAGTARGGFLSAKAIQASTPKHRPGTDETQGDAVEFSWSQDEHVIVPERTVCGLAAYLTPASSLIIRQTDYPQDDTLIIIERQHVAEFARAIAELAEMVEPVTEGS